jgi:hypothetical protein
VKAGIRIWKATTQANCNRDRNTGSSSMVPVSSYRKSITSGSDAG